MVRHSSEQEVSEKPYGWRGRFGFINPSIWDTTAYEFQRILPEGVMPIVYSLGVQRLTDEHFERARGRMLEALEALIGEESQAVCVGGVLPMLRGDSGIRKMISRLRESTGIPIQQTLEIVQSALHSLDAQRIAIVTPYSETRNEQVKAFFVEKGCQVLRIRGLGIERNVDLTRVSPRQAYLLALEVARAAREAQAIYFPCSRWAIVSLIPRLEEELGLPVVTNVQAVSWWALHAIGAPGQTAGGGHLFAARPPDI